jgi:hypothetical protein
MIFLTTLPKFPDHPFVVETMTKAEYNNALYVYTIDDNKELTQAQYDACVRRAGGKDSIDFRREYMCELVRDPTILVVPDFEESRHVKDFEYMDHCHMHVGGDWGGVRDMTALLLMSHDFANDRILVFDERIFPPNTSTNAIIAEARKMEGARACSRSIDMPGQLQVDLTAFGYEAQMPPKDDWRAAINSMAVKFSLNKIWVHKRCRFLIQSRRSGTFNKNKTDFERTSILGHCDALAALMHDFAWTTGSIDISIDVDFTHYFHAFLKGNNQLGSFLSSKSLLNSIHLNHLVGITGIVRGTSHDNIRQVSCFRSSRGRVSMMPHEQNSFGAAFADMLPSTKGNVALCFQFDH